MPRHRRLHLYPPVPNSSILFAPDKPPFPKFNPRIPLLQILTGLRVDAESFGELEGGLFGHSCPTQHVTVYAIEYYNLPLQILPDQLWPNSS